MGTSPNRSTSNSPTNNGDISTLQQRRRSRADPTSDDAPHHIPFLNNASINDFEHGNRYNASVNDNQYKASHDWYPENHSRLAVPYDDLTAIDWIHEYAKERARIRHLHNSTTHPSATAGVRFFGYLRQMADDSQTWWILVATGIAVGAIAAGIDIAVDWLADLKTGICKDHGDGGAFYLKRGFCCWGYEDLDQCPDWSTWSGAVGVKSAGGGWIVNFVFYVMFSVSRSWTNFEIAMLIILQRSFLQVWPPFWSQSLVHMPNRVVYPRSRLFWAVSLSGASWAFGLWSQSHWDWFVFRHIFNLHNC